MSGDQNKTKMDYMDASNIADQIVKLLMPSCIRLEVAGSLRRKTVHVGNIEMVAKPKMVEVIDLFGEIAERHSMLNDFNYSDIGEMIKGGDRYKQIRLNEGINLDLFIVLPPAQWGVILTLRTGNTRFSKLAVTSVTKRGLLPLGCKTIDGGVHFDGKLLLMPEEEDFLEFIGQPGLPPEERSYI